MFVNEVSFLHGVHQRPKQGARVADRAADGAGNDAAVALFRNACKPLLIAASIMQIYDD